MDRRLFMVLVATGATLLKPRASVSQTVIRQHPDPTTFQTGDLVWPKRPNEVIPYSNNQLASGEELRAIWRRERDRAIEAEENQNSSNDRIADLSYEEFEALYFYDQHPGDRQVYSGAVGTGHVGVIEIDNEDKPWIIEAMIGSGVIRSRYEDWVRSRASSGVWHGRVKSIDGAQRIASVRAASAQIGKPYDFWNFDLDDTAAFYCSKLVWYAFMRGAGIPVDGNSRPERSIWLSPRQLLNSSSVEQLFKPGTY